MNSEKVKEIKKIAMSCVERNKPNCKDCPKKDENDIVLTCRSLLKDIPTLIDELESENERLSNALEDNVTAYKDGFQDGASLKVAIKNELIKENKQLKDRIAELEKENAKLKGEQV